MWQKWVQLAVANDMPDATGRATLVKTILTIVFVAAALWYASTRMADIRAMSLPSARAVAVVVFGFVASVFFRSVYNFITSRRLGADLSLHESFMLSAVVTAGNVILPANPGATFRAVYMKKVHAFPYSFFASSAVLHMIITVLMMSFVAVGLLVAIYFRLGYFRLDLFIVLPSVALLAGAGLAIRGHPGSSKSALWSSFRTGYLELVKDHQLIYACVLVALSNLFIASLVWVMVLREYAPGIAMLEAFLFAASQIASGLINLTPGAAGFQELVGVYVGKSFSLAAVELFTILIWVRLVRTLAAIVLGIPCAIGLRIRLGRQ